MCVEISLTPAEAGEWLCPLSPRCAFSWTVTLLLQLLGKKNAIRDIA